MAQLLYRFLGCNSKRHINLTDLVYNHRVVGESIGMKRYLLSFFITLIFTVGAGAETEPAVDLESEDEAQVPIVIKTFGCLLPVTGEYGVLGNKALRGVAVATETSSPDIGYEVGIEDIGEETAGIEGKFRALASHAPLSFVVGPLPSLYSKHVYRAAYELGVPTVTFPVSEASSLGGPYIIKFFYSLEAQTRALVKFAAEYTETKTYGVLYPETKYGERLKDLFVSEVKRRGGEVTYIGSYNQVTRDISSEVEWVRSVHPKALFIPDSGANAADIILRIKQDRSFGDILFIGLSNWNSPSFLNLVANEIDGVIYRVLFTDYFVYGDDEWSAFERAYKSKFEEEPEVLEFQVFGAVKLMLGLLDADTTPRGLLSKLRRLNSKYYDVKQEKNGSVAVTPKYSLITINRGRALKIKKLD